MLEEEFAEMEGFEARVKRLRERREALRVVSPEIEVDEISGEGNGEVEAEGSSSSEDEDGWGFGVS